MDEHFWNILVRKPDDYTTYGGTIERWDHPEENYPDCSSCKFFVPLAGDLGSDWGVCSNIVSQRAGLLTFEHQAGYKCFPKGE